MARHFADIALVQAAIEAYSDELALEQQAFLASARRGRPHVRRHVGRKVELRYRGHLYPMTVHCLDSQRYRVVAEGASLQVESERLGRFEYWLTISGQRFHVVSISQGASYRIEVNGVSHQVHRDDGGVVRAPSPSVVVSIAVKPGDTVALGDPLAVLEAMKMETQIVAPFSGRVKKVFAIPFVQLDAGAPLAPSSLPTWKKW